MSIQDDFKNYTDQYGLVQPNPNGGSGNGLLYTAEAIVALFDKGALSQQNIDDFKKAYASCEKEPGLMMRSPIGGPMNSDGEAPDDYVGCGAASFFLNDGLAERILKYGRGSPSKYGDTGLWARILYLVLSKCGLSKIPYNYNNVDPGVWTEWSWLGRQQNLICHLQFAAGETPPIWRRLWWCAAVFQATRAMKSEHDSWILSWLLIRTMNGRSWICKQVANYWWKKLLNYYPQGMSSVFADYFGNPNHPTAVHVGMGK